MSRYSDLRWKIADLEKKLEEEEVYNKKLKDELEHKVLTIYSLEKDIKEMHEIIRSMKAGDNNAE